MPAQPPSARELQSALRRAVVEAESQCHGMPSPSSTCSSRLPRRRLDAGPSRACGADVKRLEKALREGARRDAGARAAPAHRVQQTLRVTTCSSAPSVALSAEQKAIDVGSVLIAFFREEGLGALPPAERGRQPHRPHQLLLARRRKVRRRRQRRRRLQPRAPQRLALAPGGGGPRRRRGGRRRREEPLEQFTQNLNDSGRRRRQDRPAHRAPARARADDPHPLPPQEEQPPTSASPASARRPSPRSLALHDPGQRPRRAQDAVVRASTSARCSGTKFRGQF